MNNQKIQMLKLLQLNRGFAYPEKWLDYAIKHDFRRIHSRKLNTCPDCNADLASTLGQFVYYSTLVKLKTCGSCGLVYADTHIDSSVIQAHFEQAYKDDNYFLKQRTRIFDQMTHYIDKMTPHNGSVLDIGGAKGHLLATLKSRRPDLDCYLNDLSKTACHRAEAKYGFKTITGTVNALENISRKFDAVILSDVIYYEPELRRLLTLLPKLITRNGGLIIRVPNNLAMMRFYQFIKYRLLHVQDMDRQDEIRFFNPEHLYVFSRDYLINRLKGLNFTCIEVLPAALPAHDHLDILCNIYYLVGKIVSKLSFGKLIITPAIVVIARQHRQNSENRSSE